jgi:hypothetical protein
MSQSLVAIVIYNGQPMKVVDVINIIYALPPNALLTTTEVAIVLRSSVTHVERLRKKGTGPIYSQAGGVGAKGTNQACFYEKADLLDWVQKNKVSNLKQAAIRKGQLFSSFEDLAEQEAFYVTPDGVIESMVEENLLGTVVERIGQWDIAWMTPVEAAARAWSDLAWHKEFAANVGRVLHQATRAVEQGVEATDIRASLNSEEVKRPELPTRRRTGGL